mgnify:CR=1 FL=1
MKTRRILKSKTCASLTKNEMLKILGGENGVGGGSNNSTANTSEDLTKRSDAAKNTIQNIR